MPIAMYSCVIVGMFSLLKMGKILRAILVLKLLLLFVSLTGHAGRGLAKESTSIIVTGWPAAGQFDQKKSPPLWLGDDAIIGRLACPSVLRLEVNHGKNAPLLLKMAPVVQKNGGSETWTLSLRPGLRWWSGASVDADALRAWLRENLVTVAKQRLGDDAETRSEMSVVDNLTVKIFWPKSPGYGPYVLSGVSFYRMTPTGFECAGLYSIAPVSGGVELSVSKGYSSRVDTIRVLSRAEPLTSSQRGLAFSMAGRRASVSKNNVKASSCDARLDVPVVTALIWNPKSSLAMSPSRRNLLTKSVPRGEILRTAASDVGRLLSGPILRSHPGYEPRLLVKPFQLDAAAQQFDAEGLKRQHFGLPRQLESGKPAQLRIARINGRQDLLEKMISDAFASIGITSQFEDVDVSASTVDAALANMITPWPSQDLRDLAHSDSFRVNSRNPLPFIPVADKELDSLMDAYTLALTTSGMPNFSLLRKIHQKWYDLEPWTVILAHQYCVEQHGLPIPREINALDLDWFRSIVLGGK